MWQSQQGCVVSTSKRSNFLDLLSNTQACFLLGWSKKKKCSHTYPAYLLDCLLLLCFSVSFYLLLALHNFSQVLKLKHVYDATWYIQISDAYLKAVLQTLIGLLCWVISIGNGLVLKFSLEMLSGPEIYIRWQIYSVLEWNQFVSAQKIRHNPHLQLNQKNFPCKTSAMKWEE